MPVNWAEVPIFPVSDLPLPDRRAGKVRESYALGRGRRLMVTTDRLSAFDMVLGCVPAKGQVLNQLSAWWFEQLADVCPNHWLATPDPNAQIVKTCSPLPVEVVVRGYITGVTSTSLWTRYAAGEREIYGHRLPEGLQKNDPLPEPLITPTTKAADGGHDEPLSGSDVVSRGLLEADSWHQVQQAALALFGRGRAVAAERGLVLVDTKYEFGRDEEGRLLLIDEVHTPDSSRYWDAVTRESLDKEVVRMQLAERGFTGEGELPTLTDEFWRHVGMLYARVFERLTGTELQPATDDANERLTRWVQSQ